MSTWETRCCHLVPDRDVKHGPGAVEIRGKNKPYSSFAGPRNDDHAQLWPEAFIKEIQGQKRANRYDDIFAQVKAKDHHTPDQGWTLQRHRVHLVGQLYVQV